MQLKEIMTRDVEVVPPECTLCEAAQTMRDLDIGALPVCDGERLVGMITDRDITIRGAAKGFDPNKASVEDCMSPEILYCFEDQETEDAEELMQERQVRRLPVLNRGKKLTGIVALADFAMKTGDSAEVGRTVREISQPTG